jgi:FK506-binding protein 2
MRSYNLILTLIALFTAFAMASRPDLPSLDGLQIEVLNENPSAKRFTKRGDTIDVHYKGTLTNGDKFDASYDRGQPLSFTVGKGQVIKGWDEGLLNMAVGDKRKLTIAPEIAYGQRAMGPIPAGSTLSMYTWFALSAPRNLLTRGNSLRD